MVLPVVKLVYLAVLVLILIGAVLMFVEDLETLPEEIRDQFEPYELDGKKGFQHKDTTALANALKNAKTEKEDYRSKYTEISNKLSEHEKSQAEKIEQAKQEALEKAKSNGDVEAIEKRYQEQMADLERRVREEARQEASNEFLQEQAVKDANAIADKIGLTLGVDTDSGEAIADLIRSRVKKDPKTGQEIYHDTKGGALSVDRNGFIELLKKESRFARLMKAEFATNGGGNANGSNNQGGASILSKNQAAQDAIKNRDMNSFLKASLNFNQ